MSEQFGAEFLKDKENAEVEQSLSLEETSRYSSKYIKSEGTLASGDMAAYRQRRKDAQKQIREVIGDARFEGYMGATANHRSAQDEQFSRMATAQMSHGLEVANKNQQESESNTLIEQHTMESSATVMEQADAGDKAATDLNNKLDWVKTTREAMYHQIDLDESLDEEQKKTKKEAVDIAVAAQNTAYGVASQVEMKEIFGRRKDTAVKQCATLKKAVDDCFKRQYAFRKQMGGDHETCYADAMAASRNFALRYFKERIARGNIDEAMTQLTYFSAMSDAAFKESCVVKDKNGKPILDEKGNRTFDSALGVADPSNLLWCRREDFKELSKAAQAAIEEVKRRKNAELAANNAALKVKDDNLSRLADNVEYGFKKYYASIIDSDTDPIAQMQTFIKQIDELKKMGYKDAGGLYDKLQSAAQGILTIRDSAEKRTKQRTAEENLIEYDTLYNTYLTTSADSVFLSFLTPNGTVQQNAKTKGTETRAACIALGQAMLNNCNDALTQGQKDSIRGRIAEFGKQKVENDCATLQKIAHDIGFTLPQDQTKMIFQYRQMAYQEVDGAPSKQVGSEVLFNKDGLVMMGDQMTVTWKDGKGHQWQLGKNEAQQIFRRMFHIISQTPVDELKDAEAYKMLKRDFSGACEAAARDTDANNRMSKLASQFDKLDVKILGRGGSKSLAYVTRNYRTPQQHQREIEWRQKAEAFRRRFNPLPDFSKPMVWDK